ncbi:MAG: hypothetical protein K0R31_1718, partial [Clostridiales bacterium]|nr:hypothetical protein [Clostridiales bacterium]
DLPYAREICKGKASYFNPWSTKSMSECIKKMSNEARIQEYISATEIADKSEGYTDFIKIIHEYVSNQSRENKIQFYAR